MVHVCVSLLLDGGKVLIAEFHFNTEARCFISMSSFHTVNHNPNYLLCYDKSSCSFVCLYKCVTTVFEHIMRMRGRLTVHACAVQFGRQPLQTERAILWCENIRTHNLVKNTSGVRKSGNSGENEAFMFICREKSYNQKKRKGGKCDVMTQAIQTETKISSEEKKQESK